MSNGHSVWWFQLTIFGCHVTNHAFSGCSSHRFVVVDHFTVTAAKWGPSLQHKSVVFVVVFVPEQPFWESKLGHFPVFCLRCLHV